MNAFRILKVLMVALALSSTNLIAGPQLKLAFQNTDNTPFQIGDGESISSDMPGVAVEQIIEAAAAAGVEVSLRRLPWKRGLRMLEQGSIDGLFSASYKPERERYAKYPMAKGDQGEQLDITRRSYSNSYSYFVNRTYLNQWKHHGTGMLSKAVEVPLGFSIASDLRNSGVEVKEVRNVYNSLKLLNLDRIQAVALLTPSGEALLKPFDRVVKVSPPIIEKPYFLVFSHQFFSQYPALANVIWDRLAEIREREDFSQRFLKYQKYAESSITK